MSKGPTDFNDVATLHGGQAVLRQLKQDMHQLDEAMRPVPDDDDVPDYMDEAPPPDAPQPNAARDTVEWRHQFETDRYGHPKASLKNVRLVLEHDQRWQGVLGYCEFSYRVLKLKPPPTGEPVGEWNDSDPRLLRNWVANFYGFTPVHGDITDALLYVAKLNRFNPVRDYLEGLQWDEVPRLDGWLSTAFESTENSRYLKLIGPMVLIGSVARVFEPGCKMDNVLILEGKQGKGKSTVLKILFGDWFTDAPLPIGDKDAYQVIQGIWGCEIPELDSFHKAEVTTLKRFFSQAVDRYRPSYGHVAQDHPRQTIFFGTTNQDVYLRDYTGNRRFWPVFCQVVNKAWVTKYRDQLWAEALHRYKEKERYWIDPEKIEDAELMEIVEQTQDSRRQEDPWEGYIIDYLVGKEGEQIPTKDILAHAIKKDPGAQTQADMNRVGPIMRSLGWKTKKLWTIEAGKKVQRRLWINEQAEKDKSEVPLDE